MKKTKLDCSSCKYAKFGSIDNCRVCMCLGSPFYGEPLDLTEPCHYYAKKRVCIKDIRKEADDEEE